MNNDLSFMDAIDELTGFLTFVSSVVKSDFDPDYRLVHEILRDNISPNLPLFTPRIVEYFRTAVEEELGDGDNKLIEEPVKILQKMIAGAMATVFMGPEIAKSQKVVDSFIDCTYDLGKVIMGVHRKQFWHAFSNRAKYGVMNPLRKHVEIMLEAATPVILERRRLEAEAVANNQEYKRPLDILQILLDKSDSYGFVDIEDICGHLLLLVLASVHTTSDSSAILCYFLGAHPQYIEPLYEEQQEILGQIAKERQLERQNKLVTGEVVSDRDFEGTELDPRRDMDFSAAAVKRMVRMDSFVREIFRFRVERLTHTHMARKRVVLSNGMVITKGKIKTVGSLMVSKYSKIEIQDPSKTKQILLSRGGAYRNARSSNILSGV
ncbi:hypothetical protein BGZ98_000262 [Dissophora globulifera]|nr:hypothetical protein BGZ98_000262 [Dissophora globulifera]